MKKDITNKMTMALACIVVAGLLTIPTILACSVPPAKIELIDPDSNTIKFTFSTCPKCTTCPGETGNKWYITVRDSTTYRDDGTLQESCTSYNTATSFKLDPGTYTVTIYSHSSATYSIAKFNYDGKKITMIEDWKHNKCKEISEFTTIAIPVAAILGLVFLFSRRKLK